MLGEIEIPDKTWVDYLAGALLGAGVLAATLACFT